MQETGRAGRDGSLARCALFFDRHEARRACHLMKKDAKVIKCAPGQLMASFDLHFCLVSLHYITSALHALVPHTCTFWHACLCMYKYSTVPAHMMQERVLQDERQTQIAVAGALHHFVLKHTLSRACFN